MNDSDEAFRAGAQAAADQANAAAMEYADGYGRFMREVTGQDGRAETKLCDMKIIAMLAAEIGGGAGRECPHRPVRGQLMFWNARTRILMCEPCNAAGSLALAASYARDITCDVCGIKFEADTQGQRRWGMRSMLLKAGVGPNGHVAATMVTYMACAACREES